MTFEGSEPRPPDAPPPPPPPPDLAPPPGYTAYSQNLSSSVDLKRIGGLSKAILILLVVYVVGCADHRSPARPGVVDSAKDYLAGDLSEDDFATTSACTG